LISSDDGAISEGSLREFAERVGTSPEQARQNVNVAVAGYVREAVTATAKAAGVNEELAMEALGDARASRKTEVREAMFRHLHEGTTAQYTAFVTDYVAALGDTAPAEVLGAECMNGVRVFQGMNGEVMIDPNDGQGPTRYEDAVRSGRIVVSRHRGR
jgi:hypothetical protein